MIPNARPVEAEEPVATTATKKIRVPLVGVIERDFVCQLCGMKRMTRVLRTVGGALHHFRTYHKLVVAEPPPPPAGYRNTVGAIRDVVEFEAPKNEGTDVSAPVPESEGKLESPTE